MYSNVYDDVADLKFGFTKNTKIKISWEQNIFISNKKIVYTLRI